MNTEERLLLNATLSLEDKLWFLTAWSKSIIIGWSRETAESNDFLNHTGEVSRKLPVCLNGKCLQINLRDEPDEDDPSLLVNVFKNEEE